MIFNRTIEKIKKAENKWLASAYLLLRLSVIIIMIDQLLNRNYEHVFFCILTLILFLLPSIIEHKIHINIPDVFEVIILLFIYAAEILGEINSYYLIYPYWDTILHTLNGFLAAAIGFSLIDLLNKNDNFSIHLSPLFVALVAFCFSMTIGVLWEFFEFAMDNFMGMDMQKDTILTDVRSVLLHPQGLNTPIHIPIEKVIVNNQVWEGYIDIGLYDTMYDLIVNFIGATVYSIFGYIYIVNRGKGNLISAFKLTSKSQVEYDEDDTGEILAISVDNTTKTSSTK